MRYTRTSSIVLAQYTAGWVNIQNLPKKANLKRRLKPLMQSRLSQGERYER